MAALSASDACTQIEQWHEQVHHSTEMIGWLESALQFGRESIGRTWSQTAVENRSLVLGACKLLRDVHNFSEADTSLG